jgi:hypothetical protein
MRRLVALVLCYGAAVSFLTWPLARHLTTQLPHTTIGCDFDSLAATWILAHVSRWLAAPCGSLLGDANIYYPASSALFYGPTCLSAVPFFTPVFLWSGNPTLAINVVLLAGIGTTAVAVHYVTWRWTQSDAAGTVAATAFLTTRWVLWDWIAGAPWFATLWCFPIVIFLAARSVRGLRDAALLVGLIALQCATDPVYVAPAVLGPLAGIAIVRMLSRPTRAGGAGLLGCVVLGGALFVAAHVGQLSLARREDLSGQTMWWFPVPPAAFPFGLLEPLSPVALPVVAWALGVVATAFALRRRSWDDAQAGLPARHALWWAVAGILLSVTPVVVLFGHTVHVRPLEWLEAVVPIHARLRNPVRMRVAGLFGLSLLAGLGFDRCARRLQRMSRHPTSARRLRAALAGAVVITMYAEYRAGLPSIRPPLPSTYPIAPAPTLSPALLRLLREPGGPMLELPIEGPVPIYPPSHARAMYRSIAHGRRLLNGYTSYYPAGFFDRMKLAWRLPDAAALAALVDETQLEVVLVHTDELAPDARARWLAIADGREPSRLRLRARDGADLLFGVGPPATPGAASGGGTGGTTP